MSLGFNSDVSEELVKYLRVVQETMPGGTKFWILQMCGVVYL
jgi:hypothetical protein